MFTFFSLSESDIFQRYKLQTYRFAFPFGIVLSILYTVIIAEGKGAQLYFGLALFVLMTMLTIVVWAGSRYLNIVELVFYFAVLTNFLLMTQASLNRLMLDDSLTPFTLADPLNSLALWLVIFIFAGFLAMKVDQARALILYAWLGMIVLCAANIWLLGVTGQWSPAFLFRWVNPLSGLLISTLLIQRMGAVQRHQATTDALTGIMNRYALYPLLEQELERATRYRRPFSLIVFDLDHFKSINDSLGHLEGDNVLKEIVQLVNANIRKTDHLGRWGGEEFLLLLPETEPARAGLIAERLRTGMQDLPIKTGRITASFGVASYDFSSTSQKLLQAADNAMYQAKQNGRNCVVAAPDCQ